MGQFKPKRGYMYPSGWAGCLTGYWVKQNCRAMRPSALPVCASPWGWP